MCGVPYHSADSYIETLINNGYKVAICEQMEDPKQTKAWLKESCKNCHSWYSHGTRWRR